MRDNKPLTVYLSGPNYHPEENESLRFLANYLEKSGFRVYSSNKQGFQNVLFQFSHEQNLESEKIYSQLYLMAFAHEYYLMITADICVGCLNGRVPDESTVIKMGIAFGSGIPVILYKLDPRILFPTGLNSMISGLSGDFKFIKNVEELPLKIHEKVKNKRKKNESDIVSHLPPYNLTLFNLGKEIQTYFIQHKIENPSQLILKEIKDLFSIFSTNESYLRIFASPFNQTGNLNKKNSLSKLQGKVYCSGALFCPEEVREMKIIATTLENYSLQTFLPQRDGGEPFIVSSIDHPLAGSLISKPIAHLLDKILFSIDINAIFQCEYFVINLNGRVPDDGAMAELGVAFAAGKPIIIFQNDLRTFSNGKIHPTIEAVAFGRDPIKFYHLIPSVLEQIVRYLQSFGENVFYQNLPENVKKVVQYGEKWSNRLKGRKIPENKMETWNKMKL